MNENDKALIAALEEWARSHHLEGKHVDDFVRDAMQYLGRTLHVIRSEQFKEYPKRTHG